MIDVGAGAEGGTEGPRDARAFGPAIAITVGLFFLWGIANNLNDILIAQFKKAFTLSDFGTSFVQQVFYLGYFLFAVPASLLMARTLARQNNSRLL